MSRTPEHHPINERTYLFHGDAVAATGRFIRPVESTIGAQVSVALPIDGGVGHVTSGPFSHHGIYQFDAAHSQVAGHFSEKKGAFCTLAQTVTEGLNIQEMVTCDRLVSRIAVHHKHGEEPYITPLGSTIHNLRIGGYKIEPVLDVDWFSEFGTWTAFLEHQSELAGDRIVGHGKHGEDKPHVFHYSMVKSWGDLPRGIAPHGHGLWVPEFGVVYIGEIFIARSFRRVRMVRTRMGCGTEGGTGSGMSGGGGEGFGT
jgi:hypothetical protein